MHAEILRLEGEYALSKGQLKTAKEKLLQSINKNKKEAKTWISYPYQGITYWDIYRNGGLAKLPSWFPLFFPNLALCEQIDLEE